MAWKKVTISTFLNERKGRYKPDEAMRMKLKRIEKIDFSNNIHLSDTTETKTDMILVKQGDLVISGINAEKGAIAIYRGEEDIMATIHYSSYTYNENEIDIDYLKWFLKSETFLNALKEQTKGGIKTELKPNRLLPLEIYLPNKPTQKEILNKLNNIEEEVLELEENIDDTAELLKKLRQSFLQDGVTGKLVPQNANDKPTSEILKQIKAEKEKLIMEGKLKKEKPFIRKLSYSLPFEIPKGWALCEFSDLIFDFRNDVRTGPFGTSLKKSEHQPKGIPVWGIESISKQGVFTGYNKIFVTEKKSIELKSFFVKPLDLIISRSGTIGELCVIPEGFPSGILSTNLMKISLDKRIILPEYFCHIIKGANYIREMLYLLCKGSTRLFLTQKILNNLIFAIPPIAEQVRILKKVEELFEQSNALEKEIMLSRHEADLLLNAILRETFQQKKTKDYSPTEIPVSTAAEE